MKKFIFLTGFLFCSFFNLYAFQNLFELELKKVSHTTEDFSFFNITHILPASVGGYFVADLNQNLVIKFNSEDEMVSSAGREGRGPGEFIGGPFQLVEKSGLLYVFDFSPARLVQVFDSELNYVKTLNLRFGNTVSTFSDSLFILGYHHYENDTYLHLHNHEGEQLFSLPLDDIQSEYTRLNEFSILRNDDSSWYALIYHFQNRIDILDCRLNKINSLSIENLPEKAPVKLAPGTDNLLRSFDGKKRDVLYRSSYFPEYRIFMESALDQNGKIFLQVNPTLIDDPEKSIYVIDEGGELLAIANFPKNQILMNIGDGGKLFSISSGRSSLYKYQIINTNDL